MSGAAGVHAGGSEVLPSRFSTIAAKWETAAAGDGVVHHDDGYSIRTRGCFGAIAFDWLHDAPAMTGELRKHAIDRFVAWNKWFGESGYSRNQPIANYYIG